MKQIPTTPVNRDEGNKALVNKMFHLLEVINAVYCHYSFTNKQMPNFGEPIKSPRLPA